MPALKIHPRLFGYVSVGLALGLVVLLPARVAFYEQSGLTPHMAPQIAYFFSPVIFVVLLVLAFVAELPLQRWLYRPQSRTEAFIVGITHVTFLLFWAFPGYGWVMVVVNPLSLRWLIAKAFHAYRHIAHNSSEPA